MNNPLAKRLFFSQRGAYCNFPSLTWLCGVALHGAEWKALVDIDIMIFQESIDNYRSQGIDATIEKVLLHELQHIAICRKGLQQVEPLVSFAQEYGIIEGMAVPKHFHYVQPHWMLPDVRYREFYGHAKIEDYEVEWYEVPQDSVYIQKFPPKGLERV